MTTEWARSVQPTKRAMQENVLRVHSPFIQSVETKGAFGSTSKSRICMGKTSLPSHTLFSARFLGVSWHLTQLTYMKKYRAKAWRRDPSGRPKKEIDRLLGEHFARFYLHGFSW